MTTPNDKDTVPPTTPAGPRSPAEPGRPDPALEDLRQTQGDPGNNLNPEDSVPEADPSAHEYSRSQNG